MGTNRGGVYISEEDYRAYHAWVRREQRKTRLRRKLRKWGIVAGFVAFGFLAAILCGGDITGSIVAWFLAICAALD